MITRKIGVGVLASMALVVAACSSGATANPSFNPATLKIGLVTDVGKLNDQNFNQYSWEGAQDGATQIGAPAPKSAQSVVSADIKTNIQAFVDQKFPLQGLDRTDLGERIVTQRVDCAFHLVYIRDEGAEGPAVLQS